MGSATKLKACFACTRGKRYCDKTQPSCGRCNERMVECRYPPLKRQRTEDQSFDPTSENSILEPGYDIQDLFNWSSTVLPSLNTPRALSPPEVLTFSSSLKDTPSCLSVETPGRDHKTWLEDAWFISPASWNVVNPPGPLHAVPSPTFVSFLSTIESWLISWAATGHCPILHHQLYADSSLPVPIQDAFASVTIHAAQTPENASLAVQVVAARAEALLSAPDPSPSDTRAHLARVQSLLIHLLLLCLLPSAPLPYRATFQKHISRLLVWNHALWASALTNPLLAARPPHSADGAAAAAAAEEEKEDARFRGDPAPRLWRAWILAESVRRTWLLVTSTLGIWAVVQGGTSTCGGGVRVTAASGFWDARTAGTWAALCRRRDPLFLETDRGADLMVDVPPWEVDGFAVEMIRAVFGGEMVESWEGRFARGKDA